MPGPQAQLYFLGGEVEATYPLGPLFHGCGLNVDGDVAERKAERRRHLVSRSCCLDLWRLVDDFDVALEEVLECTGPARNLCR